MPVGLAALAALILLAGCGGSGGRKGTAPASPSGPTGGYAIGRLTQTLVDTSRPTAANGDAPARPTRTLETVLLYPVAAGGPLPLVVFAHGFTGSPAAYDGLLRAWAAAGYVVAAPTFPLSNGEAPGGPTPNDLPNQPGDVSFVITQVLQLSRGDGPIHGAVDPDHIAVAGHSMGAFTTLGVVLNTCCHDDRVTAAVVLAGSEVPFPNGAFSVPDPTPALFVHGDADDVVPYGGGRRAFADAVAPKFFVTLPGGDHFRPFSGGTGPASAVVVRGTLDFFDRYLKSRPDGLSRLRNDANTAGVASLEVVEK